MEFFIPMKLCQVNLICRIFSLSIAFLLFKIFHISVLVELKLDKMLKKARGETCLTCDIDFINIFNVIFRHLINI